MSADSVTVILTLAAGLNGVMLGVLFRDWSLRKKEVVAIEDSKNQINENMTKMAQVHNGLAEQVTRMQDKVNAHEVRLIGGLQKATTA